MIQRRFVGSGMTLGFTLAAVFLIGSSVLIHRNIQLIAENEEKVVHTHEVLTALNEVRAALGVAESSQRGYLITSEQAYLAPYQAAVPEVLNQLKQVQRQTADNENQVREFPKLVQSVNTRLATLAEGIGVVENNGREAARDFVLRGEGAIQMKVVRDHLTNMIAEERRLLDRRRRGV